MTTVTHKTARIAEALAKFIEEFQGQTNIEALASAIVQQCQDLEDAAFTVIEDTALTAAAGEQLDGVGQVVGEAREGRSDTDYAIALRVRILLNKTSGTVEDILEVCVGITDGLVPFTVRESYPAAVEVTAEGTLTNGSTIAALTMEARDAGVEGNFRWFEATLGTEFRFDTAGQGFDQGLLGESILV